jgi:hypothetical protein
MNMCVISMSFLKNEEWEGKLGPFMGLVPVGEGRTRKKGEGR